MQNMEHANPVSPASTLGQLRITIDPNVSKGPIKPVNGVGQPPILGIGGNGLFHYLSEAGIPFSRLHDTGGAFGKNLYVDIPNLFRDFDADENDPANYDFTFTDDLMVKLDEAHVRPYFRLGVTIENGAAMRAYRIFPPKDFEKWARICEHVMAHYVEGWANGPRVQVSHWEIWNEADNHPDEKLNQMWRAPFEEFIRLYITAAKHLKARFPKEKVGGFGSCGFYHVATGDMQDQAIHHMKCIEAFFAAVKRENAPLDFFSFHSYANVNDTIKHARVAREYADKYGFSGIELSLNEWLPCPWHEKLGSALQASEIAAELIVLQNGPVDSACIYDARCGVGDYSPLFNPLSYQPHKAYYAFLAFNELRKRGTAVKVDMRSPFASADVYAAAARGDDGSVAVMLANAGNESVPFGLVFADGHGVELSQVGPAPRCRITDETRTWEEIGLPGTLPPHSILCAGLDRALETV